MENQTLKFELKFTEKTPGCFLYEHRSSLIVNPQAPIIKIWIKKRGRHNPPAETITIELDREIIEPSIQQHYES